MKVEVLPPQENMRRDEEFLLSLERGTAFPGYRIYKWDRVCLSLGHFQKEKRFPNLPVVRRPTGGGALLHGWDLSFSIVDFKERWGGKPSSIYRNVSGLLRDVFASLGAQVSMERFKGRYLDRFFCFWVPTLGELTYRGRKIAAMAMRTQRRAFLLHGSVYTSFDYSAASRLIGVSEKLLRDRVVSLSDIGIGEEDFLTILEEKLSSALPSQEADHSSLPK